MPTSHEVVAAEPAKDKPIVSLKSGNTKLAANVMWGNGSKRSKNAQDLGRRRGMCGIENFKIMFCVLLIKLAVDII